MAPKEKGKKNLVKPELIMYFARLKSEETLHKVQN